MQLQEHIRKDTYHIKDALKLIEARQNEVGQRTGATESRMKRLRSDMSGLRKAEGDAKHARTEAGSVLREVQTVLDDLEEQRSMAMERFAEAQDAKGNAEALLRKVQGEIEAKEKEIGQAGGQIADVKEEYAELNKETQGLEENLREAQLGAIDNYVCDLEARIDEILLKQDERSEKLAARRRLTKARGENPEIGSLCEQREEILRFLPDTRVPGVKDLLRQQIEKIEAELQRRFPGALDVDSEAKEARTIYETYYYADSTGKAMFLIPISAKRWRNIQVGDRDCEQAVRFLWSMIDGLALEPSHGTFILNGTKCLFASTIDYEDVEAMESFKLHLEDGSRIDFRLLSVPHEVQEVLSDETTDA